MLKPNWMTDEAFDTIKKGYLQDGEKTPFDAWKRVAKSASIYLEKNGFLNDYCQKFEKDLYDILQRGYLGLASPVFTNLGIDGKGLPISCFSISVDDSISGIFDSLAESAKMTQKSGGVGVYLGNIRPSGSSIHSGGTSTGVLPFAKLFDSTAKTVAQGSMRRGSFALYLPIDHPDVKELLQSKDHTQGDSRRWIDSNIAVTITDKWMEEMLAGDKDKQELFVDIIITRLKSGSPYILYIDNVNNANPEAYKKNNLKVETSNLCLTGETEVLTYEGNLPIKDLVGKEVKIFDGNQWIKVNNFKSYGIDNIIKITLDTGDVIRMTPDHRNLVVNERGNVKIIPGKELKVGDYLKTIPSEYNNFRIISIEKELEKEEVFCCEVPTTSFFALGNKVLTGNCSEITLYTDKNHSFICCLSSINLDKYDEWRNYTTPNLGYSVPYISTIFLDAVLSEFIDKAKIIPEMSKAVRSALKGRALGLGTQGLASLYQKRMLPFSSKEAFALNIEIHKYLNRETTDASKFLAKELGEPQWCKGTGMRNTHLLAVAPTRTNSVICNSVSQGIEPIDKNYYVAKQDKGVYIRKNPNLAKLLKEKYNRDDNYTWNLISKDEGSVRNLDFLSDYEKQVFATAREIDQKDLIRQAADRQKYICQAQSLNLFVDPHANEQYLAELHIMAWKLGVKSLYYLRSRSKQQLKTLNYLITKDDCPWCIKLKEELAIRKMEYEEIPLSEAKRRGIWNYSYKTVPQLFINSERVGGYEDFMNKYVYGTAGSPLPNTIDGELPIESECTNCEG